MTRPKLIAVGIDASINGDLRRLLREQGCECWETADTALLLPLCESKSPAAIIVQISNCNAHRDLAIIRRLHDRFGAVPLIVLTSDSSEDLAIAAFRAGSVDYFRRPIPWDEVGRSLRRHVPELGGSLEPAPIIVGDSAPATRMKAQIARLASTDSNVLITGETGTGKELIAELIHSASSRRNFPLVSINCAAIPDTLFESEIFGYERGAFTGAGQTRKGNLEMAGCGTVVFDEIGEMTMYAQAKMLRAIETRRIQRLGGAESIPLRCRFLASTNRNLERAVADGSFRKDLFFRLNVTRVQAPALRERKEDLPQLCRHFIVEFNRQFGRRVEGVEQDILTFVSKYDWPGNIRELRNFFESLFANSASTIFSLDDIPDFLRGSLGVVPAANNTELEKLLAALTACNWNKSQAAAALRWSRMTLYRKMAKHQLTGSRCNAPACGGTVQ